MPVETKLKVTETRSTLLVPYIKTQDLVVVVVVEVWLLVLVDSVAVVVLAIPDI